MVNNFSSHQSNSPNLFIFPFDHRQEWWIRVEGTRGKAKKGPFDDVILLSQP